jgi:hypothetical protein
VDDACCVCGVRRDGYQGGRTGSLRYTWPDGRVTTAAGECPGPIVCAECEQVIPRPEAKRAHGDGDYFCPECIGRAEGEDAFADENAAMPTEWLDDDGVWVDTGVPAPTKTETGALSCARGRKRRRTHAGL